MDWTHFWNERLKNMKPSRLALISNDEFRNSDTSNQKTEIHSTPALQGKVAAIARGSAGIGLAHVKRFVKEGAYVFITGRRQAELDKAVAEIGSNVTPVQGDVPRGTTTVRRSARTAQGGMITDE